MSQIGRRRPNVPFLSHGVIPPAFLVDQLGEGIAGASVTASRSDAADVAGVTTGAIATTYVNVRLADVDGSTAGAIETFATKVSYADVLGTASVIATSFLERADDATVIGAATASAVVLGRIPKPTQWIMRAPRGRF